MVQLTFHILEVCGTSRLVTAETFMMSHPAMSLGYRLCASRKGGAGREPRIPVFKANFSARASYHRPSILIAYTLMSGCGQSHECGKHGCLQFCVKF